MVFACCLQLTFAAVPPGVISLPESTSNRVVRVTVVPPTNGWFVKLSQDPAFAETSNGVRITVTDLHPHLDYADLNITYPNGVPGGRGLPAGLPRFTNEVRILLVPVRLNAHTPIPFYATNGWFQRLMFSETNGPDTRPVANSVKKYFEQTTYGRVKITGDVYPDWITVRTPREYTSGVVWEIPQRLVEDAVEAIQTRTPSFLQTNRYDFIITVHPGELAAVYNSYYEQTSLYYEIAGGLFKGSMNIDLPVAANSPLLRPIFAEANVVSNSLYVQTAMRALEVQGVWLASDTARRTNLFVGGSRDYFANVITLGTPTPNSNDAVVVRYTVGTFYREWDPTKTFFSIEHIGGWYGTFVHELAHGLGSHITFTDTEYIGDLYRGADLITDYGLMSGGNHNANRGETPFCTEPAHFDAYTKFALGILLPYELCYGESETNVRLYPTAEYPHTERTKLIKVPLQAPGRIAYRRLRDADLTGEEYLLIELRKKGPVAGIHNFDRGLPHEGVVIYHVNERDKFTIGAFSENCVRIIDATAHLPEVLLHDFPYNNHRSSLTYPTSPAPFGFDSGIFEYIHGAQWQSIGNSNITFRLEGRGPLTVYAKFQDNYTNESPVVSATTTLNTWVDANENEMDDQWETRYFAGLGTTHGAPSADPDRDGMVNLDEFRAGTNPTNPASAITLSVSIVGSNLVLRVPTVSNTFYFLEYSRDFARPRWMSSFSGGTPIPADGTVHQWGNNHRLVGNSRYYRLRVPER